VLNPFKQFLCTIFKNSVRTAKKTQHSTVIKIKLLTLFKETVAVCSEIRPELSRKCGVNECWSGRYVRGLTCAAASGPVRLYQQCAPLTGHSVVTTHPDPWSGCPKDVHSAPVRQNSPRRSSLIAIWRTHTRNFLTKFWRHTTLKVPYNSIRSSNGCPRTKFLLRPAASYNFELGAHRVRSVSGGVCGASLGETGASM
jgi:hypothetical protein